MMMPALTRSLQGREYLVGFGLIRTLLGINPAYAGVNSLSVWRTDQATGTEWSGIVSGNVECKIP